MSHRMQANNSLPSLSWTSPTAVLQSSFSTCLLVYFLLVSSSGLPVYCRHLWGLRTVHIQSIIPISVLWPCSLLEALFFRVSTPKVKELRGKGDRKSFICHTILLMNQCSLHFSSQTLLEQWANHHCFNQTLTMSVGENRICFQFRQAFMGK